MSFSGRINRLDPWKLVDAWDSTYWEGGDVHVYFDDIEVTEGIQLTYQVMEEVRPYFGYASYTANRFFHGSRIISGELTINFKRAESILAILQYLGKGITKTIPNKDKLSRSELKAFEIGYKDIQSRSAQEIYNLVRLNKRASSGVLPQGAFREVKVNTTADGPLFGNTEFDIKIIYGLDSPTSNQMSYIADNSYSIDGYIPDIGYARNESTKGAATGKLLIGAHLSLSAQTVDDSGRPLVETYNFIAKDFRVLNLEDA